MALGFSFEGTSTTVAASLTSLGEFALPPHNAGGVVSLEIENTGANAFTDFRIQVRDHPSGELYDYLTAADIIDSLNVNMLFYSVDPSTLASGAKAHIKFRTNGAYSIQPQAKRTTTTTAIVRGTAQAV
jgi:hypothetical protein